MRHVAIIAAREMSERIRSRPFLISNAVIVLLILGSTLLPTVFQEDDETRVGYVGPEAEQVATVAVAQQTIFESEVVPVPVDDREAAETLLEESEVNAVLLDATTVLVERRLGPRLEALLASASNAVGVDAALAGAGLDADDRAALFAIEPLTVETRVERAEAIDLFDPAILVVYGAVFLLYGLLAIYGQWVAQGIVEEKQSRVVEVLLSTVRPTELLAGKVLGLGALGLAQILLFALLAAGGLTLTDVIDMPRASWASLALVLPWYVLGFLLYATVFAAAGSLVARVEDLQSAVMPAILVLVGALFAAQFALAAPDGTVATVAGLVPFTAPIVQPILLAVGQTTWWEVGVAILLAIATIGVLLPITGRVYRGGVLRTRSKVSLREAWSASRQGGRANGRPTST
jgi:ABC-2 type transport system permease protein